MSIPISLIFTVTTFSLIGFIDDLFGLSPFYRLFFQIVTTLISFKIGLNLEIFNFQYLPFESFNILQIPILKVALTVL